jgi:predicted AAA+ superfamily ATPase
VPQKFDLLSSQYLIQELGSATQSGGLSDITLKAFEIDFCSKKFSEQPAVKEELELNFKLDPLAAKTEDEKLAIKQGGGCREIDYIISCNIGFYVKRALDENEEFCDMNLMEQMSILEGYASAVVSNNSMKQNITAKQPPITNVIPINQEGGE